MESDVLDVPGAAVLLAVSPATVREQARMGRMPGRKVGREWRFSRQALLDWLTDGCDEPLSPDDLAAVREGVAALDRGDFITLEEYDRRRLSLAGLPVTPGSADEPAYRRL